MRGLRAAVMVGMLLAGLAASSAAAYSVRVTAFTVNNSSSGPVNVRIGSYATHYGSVHIDDNRVVLVRVY